MYDRIVKGPSEVHGRGAVGSLEAHEQHKKKKKETLDQALQMKASINDEKRYPTLKIFKVEVVEVAKMVEVVKTAAMKDVIRRRDSPVKQIGVKKDAIEEETVDQTSSAINVKNMVTMRMIAILTNVTIVAEWGTLQKIVEPKKRWKEQPI